MIDDDTNPAPDAAEPEEEESGDILRFGSLGSHPVTKLAPLLVAPTTNDEKNTLGLDLLPVACLSLRDILFRFGSSFMAHSEGTRRVLRRLPGLRKKNASKASGALPLVSVFGHADPVGNDGFNKKLSGRRSRAVFGLLTHDTSIWEDLHNNPLGDDDWRSQSNLQVMADATGMPKSTTREDLFAAYMNTLFPTPLTKSDFLGRGSDPNGRADFQGCSEFNPLVLLSTAEMATFTKEERDAENQPSRRVVLFLFSADLKIDPSVWPCPAASAGPEGCRKRFFPDGDKRRAIGPVHREYNSSGTDPLTQTFACRFYDRISRKSPCEGILRSFRVRLFDHFGTAVPGAPFRVVADAGPVRDVADEFGDAVVQTTVPRRFTFSWNRPPIDGDTDGTAAPKPASFEFTRDVFVNLEGDDLPDKPDPEPAVDPGADVPQQNLIDDPNKPPPPVQPALDETIDRESDRRLHNLGFPKILPPVERIRAFQRESGASETGKLADIDADLKKRHEDCDPPSRYKQSSDKGAKSAVAPKVTGAGTTTGPATNPPPATPLNPTPIDEALNDKTALLYSPKAPRNGIDETKDLKSDDRAVWVYIPSGFKEDKPEALFFFHGNNNYVTAKAQGGAVKPRGPSWVKAGLGNLDSPAKPNAGVIYKFDKIDGLEHQPIVFLPEVGVFNPDFLVPDPSDPTKKKSTFWATEPAGKLTSPERLGELLENCLDRLSKLAKPPKMSNYLSQALKAKGIKRLFVMGHSGGTIPLNAAASSNILLPKKAAASGPDPLATDIPTDLVPFDRSFGEDTTPYFNFCKEWDAKGLLGNANSMSRLISFYGSPSPNMGPMPGVPLKGITLWEKLKSPPAQGGLGFTTNTVPIRVPQQGNPPPAVAFPDTDMVVLEHHSDGKVFGPDPKNPGKQIQIREDPPSSANLALIREALLKDYKALFIFTNVAHDLIPTTFVPPVLEYKRNATPPTPVKPKFTLKINDPVGKPLAGAKVRVLQEGIEVFASTLGEDGTVEVTGHRKGVPCDVQVEGFGIFGKKASCRWTRPIPAPCRRMVRVRQWQLRKDAEGITRRLRP